MGRLVRGLVDEGVSGWGGGALMWGRSCAESGAQFR